MQFFSSSTVSSNFTTQKTYNLTEDMKKTLTWGRYSGVSVDDRMICRTCVLNVLHITEQRLNTIITEIE